MNLIVLFISALLCIPTLSQQTVCLIPFPDGSIQDFFDPYRSRDEITKPFCHLRLRLEKAGYQVKFSIDPKEIDAIAAVISFNNLSIPHLDLVPLKRRFLTIWEPPVVQLFMYSPELKKRFGKIFVMFDDMVDKISYFKFYYPQPHQQMIPDILPFHKKKLCVLIASNKSSAHQKSLYTERVKTITFFEKYHCEDFDLYGTSWNGRKSWKGTTHSKWDTMKRYKFCICYENMHSQNGYITEKIFDAMRTGCVPVYWGASNISESIPKECFIDRRNFSSHEELYTFLHSMSNTQHQHYIAAIKSYFASEQAQWYSIDFFSDTLMDHILTNAYTAAD